MVRRGAGPSQQPGPGRIAELNLAKARDLFSMGTVLDPVDPYDSAFPVDQQFPRRLTVTFVESEEVSKRGEQLLRVRMLRGAHPRGDVEAIGDPLDDNSEREDDYRYHDAFHLSHMAILGWSPVLRKLLDCKRRGTPAVDRIQDGGRAVAIEEGVTAYVSPKPPNTATSSSPTASRPRSSRCVGV